MPVAGDHPDHDPASTLKHFQPPDIPGVLPQVSSMLLPVVLNRDFDLVPPHIEVSDHIAKLVADSNLGLWTR